MLTATEIRASFLEFFRSKGHEIVHSSPLVLPADPTLLFANAGMNRFKEIFLGARQSEYRRVADTQKCIRVSGKHNDLEEVGHDTYHHTFFEMLGNWSFGDYYKRESIAWAWELLTTVWKLPKDRLWVSVYKDDDEAESLWREVTDVNPRHILRFGEKDNFWEMGETGPCGPCSEIHFDRTPSGCRPEQINAGNPEVIEIWNLVFIQYNRRSDGSLEELPAKHVDTGMGLERIASVIQGKPSNYDTDLFTPLLARLEQISQRRYEGENAIAMRVIADHLRTLAFAIADGVLPSNEGRGYVLRRLLRRAVRYGRKLGLEKPFINTLVPDLEKIMGVAFPEMGTHRVDIMRAVLAEEESFAGTLGRGLELFGDVTQSVMASGRTVFPGEDAFKLYDTYGFPIDLTVLLAREKGLEVDQKRFADLMEEQRQRARDARRSSATAGEADLVADLVAQGLKCEFNGYAGLCEKTFILALVDASGHRVAHLGEGEEGAVLLSKTPFYAEKGGQVGDQGCLSCPAGTFDVADTRLPADGLMLHYGRMVSGTLSEGNEVNAQVHTERRAAIARHHTATHLLQCALREVVSGTIKQAGSMVTPDRLRFDFNYFQALTQEQVATIEARVNALILRNDPVAISSMALKDVPGSGIIALFDEKYGETVRVVTVGNYSRELCGGTHVKSTGDLGSFRIIAESSIASGVRRIEALAGHPAYDATCRDRAMVARLATRFSVSAEEVPARIEAMAVQIKDLEKQVADLEMRMALGRVDGLMAAKTDVKGIPLVMGDVGEQSGDTLKNLVDAIRQRQGSGVIVLGSSGDGKAAFIASVSDELVKRGIHAGKLIKAIAAVAGGSGGGQPALARAGAKDPARIKEALDKVPEVLAEMVG